jgi:hypothetical protein
MSSNTIQHVFAGRNSLGTFVLQFYSNNDLLDLLADIYWGRRGMHIGYWWEIQKERDHWEDQDVGG